MRAAPNSPFSQRVKTKDYIRHFDPGYFAFVMATGIVSISFHLLGTGSIALALFLLNKLAWIIIFIFLIAKMVIYRAGLARQAGREGGASMFTLVAGTCILGSQYAVISQNFNAALLLWISGFLFWAVLIYSFFVLLVASGSSNAPLGNGFDGSWLIFIVGTQSISVLGSLLSEGLPASAGLLLFVSLSMYMIGAMLYFFMAGLIFYRMFFFALPPEKLSPAYWINMGAAAITTLSGAVLLLNAGRWAFLSGIIPFLKGFTFFFWAVATWWIPLLAALNIWQHLPGKVVISYDVKLWSMVFPLGMYTACTYEFGTASRIGYFLPTAAWFSYIALAAWAAVFAGFLVSMLKSWRIKI